MLVTPYSISLPISLPNISFQAILLILIHEPYIFFRFLIPVLAVLGLAISLRVHGRRRYIDLEPVMAQETEKFVVPDDYLNKEMVYVENSDYAHFEEKIEDSSKKIAFYSKYLRKNARKYKRLRYKLNYVSSEKKKKKLNSNMEKQFKDIVRIYGKIQQASIDMDLTKMEDNKDGII